MPGKGTLNLEAELLHYGVNCRSGDVHFFDGKESSEHLDYQMAGQRICNLMESRKTKTDRCSFL